MLFDEALQYLLSLGHETLAIKLGLKNIELLLAALNHPESSFRSVQIAGTNGKGSTAAMLYKIARQSGVRAGLYTSPHLSRITERIIIDGREIGAEEFARLATIVRDAAQRLCREGKLAAPPTFFEQVTAASLLAFREAEVELAILETGLGGRLDATTAAGAEVVAITPVSLDHQEYLGETLAQIAAEKGAIIRPGVTAIIARQQAEALEVIRRRAAETGVAPRFANASIEIRGASPTGNLRVSFETEEDRYEDVCLGLRGRHQVENAEVAILLAEAIRPRLGFPFSREAIIEGLERARHPGRLELREGSPSILFDGAHNPASALALRDYLSEFVKAPVTLIFGAMRDKELREMAQLLFPQADSLILTEMENPRAATLEALLEAVPENFEGTRIALAKSTVEALSLAQSNTAPDALIAVTGSLYLVGEIRDLLLKHGA